MIMQTASRPSLLSVSQNSSGEGDTLALHFSTAMRIGGSGTLYVTDGALQTVIDRATGLPTLRVVGATDTHLVSASSIAIEGGTVMLNVPGLIPGHAYHVFMDGAILQSMDGIAVSGGRTAGANNGFSFAPPVPAPTLSAELSLDGDTLTSESHIGLTIVFSSAVDKLDATLLTTPHAQLGSLVASEDHKTWHATLTPDSDDLSGYEATNSVSLDLAHVVGAGGLAGSGSVASINYVFDNRYGQARIDDIAISDTGISQEDGVTGDNVVQLRGGFSGIVGDHLHVELTFDDSEPVTVTPQATDEPGIKTWHYDGDAAHWEDGVHTVTARLVDAAGHASETVTKTFTVDTTAPMLVNASVNPTDKLDLAHDIVLDFDEAVYVPGVDATHGTVQLIEYANDGGIGSTVDIPLTDANFSQDHTRLTFAAGTLPIGANNSYAIVLENVIDAAGNGYGEHRITFSTTDTIAPHALELHASIAGDAGSVLLGRGDQVGLSVTFDESVKIVGDAPALALNNGGHAAFSHLSEDGRTVFFTYTVDAADGSVDALDIAGAAGSIGLAGHVADQAGNLLDAAHIDFSHLSVTNAHGASIPLEVKVEGLSAPALDDASDTGIKGDGITNKTHPTIVGSGAEAGARIMLYNDDDAIDWTYADSHGNWHFTPLLQEVARTYNLSVVQVDAEDHHIGDPSPTLALSVVPVPVAPSLPMLDAASDSGISHIDSVTAVAKPTLTGMADGAGGILVYDGTTLLGTTMAAADGAWTYVVETALANGVHAITATQVNAGGASAASSALTLTIDQTAPTLLSLHQESGGGHHWLLAEFSEDVVFSGGTLKLYDDDHINDVVATYTAANQGNWSMTHGTSHTLWLELTAAHGGLHVQFGSASVEDYAGNALLVGIPPDPVV